uniref:RH2 domain-containing protein n=2 Tax=Caenorhabditis japonica TaxID=281687 RepID=A0A8R1DMS4_CAEJA
MSWESANAPRRTTTIALNLSPMTPPIPATTHTHFQLQNSIEKLIRQNEELLRKNASLQKQGRVIVEEKMEVLKRLEKTEESNIELKKLVKETDRACKDMQIANQDNNEPRFTLSELREVIKEKNILKGRVMELEEELEAFKPGAKREIMRLDDEEDEQADRLAA